MTAIDSTAKKLAFIRSHTDPERISLVHARAEELGRDPSYREQFQYAVARAVAPANILLEYLSPFIVDNGYLIKDKYNPRVDYIEVIDKLYFGGMP